MASLSFYVALAGMQFADAVAIYFSLPLMIAALSGFLIGERVPPQRWVAIVVAFVGVVVIAQPTSGIFNPATLIALFSTLCYAVGLMLTRPVGMRIPSAVMGVAADGVCHDWRHPRSSSAAARSTIPPIPASATTQG